MTGQQLKWLAAFTMVLDHIGVVCIGPLLENFPDLSLSSLYYGAVNGSAQQAFLCWSALILRSIGRLAFPIFCFLLTEGFCHTKNLKKYMGRMALFALISEIPFDLAIYGSFWHPESQNVFFTLLIGLLVLYGFQKIDLICIGIDLTFLLKILVLFGGCAAAFCLKTDYDSYGILFIALLFLLRDDKQKQIFFGVLMAMLEYTAVFAFIPIWFYNGKPGTSRFRYFFYWFYPVHLLVLWGIQRGVF